MSEQHLIDLSSAWLPPVPGRGSRAWVRRFGIPGGLAAGDRVWLVIESSADCQVRLDGEALADVAAGSRWRQDVAARLKPRNELELLPAGSHAAGRPAAGHGRVPLPAVLGRVWLEIEPAAPAASA